MTYQSSKIMKCGNEFVRLLKPSKRKAYWFCDYIKDNEDNEMVWIPTSSLRELTPQDKIKLL